LFKVELTVGCLEDLCSWIEVIEFTDDTWNILNLVLWKLNKN
jgi:hypothetical protein